MFTAGFETRLPERCQIYFETALAQLWALHAAHRFALMGAVSARLHDVASMAAAVQYLGAGRCPLGGRLLREQGSLGAAWAAGLAARAGLAAGRHSSREQGSLQGRCGIIGAPFA